MPIEVLYIIPLLAVCGFVLGWILVWQKKSARFPSQQSTDSYAVVAPALADRQSAASGTIQQTIELVSSALSNQQKLIEKLTGEDSGVAVQINELKTRLTDLQKEFDVVASENLTLRASAKKNSLEKTSTLTLAALAGDQSIDAPHRDTDRIDTAILLRLSDTQEINLEDTHEIDRDTMRRT